MDKLKNNLNVLVKGAYRDNLRFIFRLFLLLTRVIKKNMRFMNNKSEYNLIPTVSDVPFGYICPSSKAADGVRLKPKRIKS